MDEHWSQTFEHESITDENREAFVSANSKYDTVEDAAIGGFNAQTKLGKPFRVPESLDTLPDDATRDEFRSQAHKALGITVPKDVEALAEMDFKAGLAEDAAYDEKFVGLVKEWAVKEGIDTGTLAKLTGFFNGPIAEYSRNAIAEQEEQKKLADAEKCNAALVDHFKSPEKVRELSTLLHRTILNNMGLQPGEAAEVVDAMADSILTRNPVMARGMLNLLAASSKEGSTLSGDGAGGSGKVKQPTPYEAKKARWPNSPEEEWGKPTDTWENEDIQVRNALGYKDPNAK